MIIYKITNMVNQKIYIGQTQNTIKHRWSQHCRTSPKKSLLSKAISKYGKVNFTIEGIDTAFSLVELNEKEMNWIRHFNSNDLEIGYNISTGGKNPHNHDLRRKLSAIGKKRVQKPVSCETKEKIRVANTGKKHSKETIQKLRQYHSTRKLPAVTNEAKKNMSKALKGRVFSEEHKINLSKAAMGKKMPPRKVPSAAKIKKEDVEKIKELYGHGLTVKEIACKYELSTSHIYSILKGKSWRDT